MATERRGDNTEYKVIRDTFRCLAEEAWAATAGEKFFPELARQLGQVLRVRAVVIIELVQAGWQGVKVLGQWGPGVAWAPWGSGWDGTVLADIYSAGKRCVAQGAREMFPGDLLLRVVGAESFFGQALYDSGQRANGLICVLDDKPMVGVEHIRGSTQIFAARAASEIERRQGEEMLRATTTRLTCLIQSVQTAVLMEDEEGRIILANPRFCDLFARRVAPEDLIGVDGAQFVAFMGDAFGCGREYEARVAEILGRRLPVVGEQLNLPDGRVLERDFIPILVDDVHLGQVWQFRDITERVQSERELARARDIAVDASHSKSAFLATMSHEIRTPMHGVIGMARLLLNSELTPEQRGYVDTIRQCGDDLLTLIDDILDLSKIEAGGLTLKRATFDVRQCVESALDLLGARAAEKRLELWCDVEEGVPRWVVGDPTRLRQILFNLVSNAVKFTDRGGVVVRLVCAGPAPGEVAEGDGGAMEFRFEVRDSGRGIAEEDLGRLFKPFSQLDTTSTREQGGTGLGLAICLRLCELMGGRIWVESEPGKGSNFQFAVPMSAVSPRHDATEGIDLGALRGAGVLLVGRDPMACEILGRLVRTCGMEGRVAAGVGGALADRPGEGAPRVVLVDIGATDDGIEEGLRLVRGADGMPVVATYPVGRTDVAERARVLGARAAVAKPIHASNLAKALAEALGGGPRGPRRQDSRGLLDPTMGDRRPLRILLAEDNRVNQKVAFLTLEKMGYLADVAETGVEVLRALERQEYDLILMDIQMPVMDGLEATRRILEAIPERRRPRIVAMTANATAEDRSRCLDVGMDDYIPKPLRLERLHEVLESTPRVGG